MDTDYKTALINVRKMLDDGFYGINYTIEWIDNVLAGKQDPSKRATQKVMEQLESIMNSNDA